MPSNGEPVALLKIHVPSVLVTVTVVLEQQLSVAGCVIWCTDRPTRPSYIRDTTGIISPTEDPELIVPR